MDDPVIRVLAINAFKRWCEWDWSRIVEEQPEKTVQVQTEILFLLDFRACEVYFQSVFSVLNKLQNLF